MDRGACVKKKRAAQSEKKREKKKWTRDNKREKKGKLSLFAPSKRKEETKSHLGKDDDQSLEGKLLQWVEGAFLGLDIKDL